MYKSLYSLLLVVLLSSCAKEIEKDIEPQQASSIFEKYKSGVVLIVSQYYYEIDADGHTFYYCPTSDDKILFAKEDAINNLSMSTGTGFIISENGEIITNNHVVNHKDEDYKIFVVDLYENLKSGIFQQITQYNDTIQNIQSEYYSYSEYMHEIEKETLKRNYLRALEEKSNLVDMFRQLENTDLSKLNSKLVIHHLGIAYNDTHVTQVDDLQECVVIKTSEDPKVDLAMIQTKTKTFNIAPKAIFNFKDNNPNIAANPEKHSERDIKNPVKINEDVYMIGFNKGFVIASTKQGIKSQFTSGKISQENDGERLLYTIPTLEGSSGSPIVDKWGNLVGVNFAKITNSQNFSFGVPVDAVKKFYEE